MAKVIGLLWCHNLFSFSSERNGTFLKEDTAQGIQKLTESASYLDLFGALEVKVLAYQVVTDFLLQAEKSIGKRLSLLCACEEQVLPYQDTLPS